MKLTPVFLEEGAMVFFKKRWTPIPYKYERTEKFYYNNNKHAIQLGRGLRVLMTCKAVSNPGVVATVSFTRKGENWLFSKYFALNLVEELL